MNKKDVFDRVLSLINMFSRIETGVGLAKWPDASASAPRSFVARLVKIVSCFSSLTNG